MGGLGLVPVLATLVKEGDMGGALHRVRAVRGESRGCDTNITLLLYPKQEHRTLGAGTNAHFTIIKKSSILVIPVSSLLAPLGHTT